MIKTFFGAGTLDTTGAFLAALIIGALFGVALEQAGFGSSRKLTGVFYFEDMAVIKVMFSALITAMLGLAYFQAAGFIGPDELYFLPTIYGAQIIGGLIFGVGFVMGGWCPGTAAVGLASGKLDALVFFSDGFGTLHAEKTGVVANQTGGFADDSVSFTPTVSAKYNVGMRNRGYIPGTGANNNESTIFFDNARLVAVPEPSAALLGGLGMLALLRRRRQA